MTRSNKQNLVQSLSNEFSNANSILVCNYKGLKCQELESLREKASENDVYVRVIKNTLANIALSENGNTGLDLSDTNIFIWSSDQVSAAKVAVEFSKANDKLEVKYGYIDHKIAVKVMIESYSNLPSKEELLGMLLSTWTAPARNFVTGLDNLRTKLEEEAA